MAKNRDAIRAVVRQMLRDEFKTTGTDFADDELNLHINECVWKSPRGDLMKLKRRW